MGVLTRMERRASLENPATSLARPSEWLFDALGGEKVHAGVRVSEDSAVRFTAVYAAVRVLAETVASLPLILYQRQEPRGKERLTSSPLYRLLHDRPNPEMTSFQWREVMQAHLALWGNAYSEIEFDGAGRPVALWPLLPDRTRAVRRGGRKLIVTRLPDGGEETIPADRVLHIPGLGFNGVQGFSPIRMARQAVGLGLAAEEFGARFFGNGARPGGILSSEAGMNVEQRARNKRSWQAAHQGVSRAHKVAVLEGGLSWQSIGIPPEEAQFLETRKFQTSEIARIYRIPPHLLGDLERATFSNIEQQSLEFVIHTIRPWLVRWEQALNATLLTGRDQQGRFFEFLVEGLLRGDTAARGAFYQQMFNIGAFSINDILEKENMNPVDGGDQRFIPLNMMPLDMADRLPAEPDPPSGADPDPDKDGPADAAARDAEAWQAQRARRSALVRDRLRQAHARVFGRAAAVVIASEISALRRIVRQTLGADGPGDFDSEVSALYDDFTDVVGREFRPVVEGYGAAIYAEVRAELDRDDDPPPEFGEFVERFTDGLAERHTRIGRNQMLALARESDDPAAAIEARLVEWEAKRPGKLAGRESVRGAGALSTAAYAALGVERVQWVGLDDCPYCPALDGRTVEIGEPFAERGDRIEAVGGAEDALEVQSTIRHGPLRNGCICQIAAA